MNTFNTIDSFVQKHSLLHPNQTIIIGLSGGPDSVFLLYYLLSKKESLNLTLIAAHLNHEWRDSAHIDADLCVKLCKQLDVPLLCAKKSDLKIDCKPSGSKEQDARIARRTFFNNLINDYRAEAVALAHHQNDQEETFFIRLLRGAALTGLSCMQPKSGPYIRPLLPINKTDILDWLNANEISFAIDPTNDSHDFLRNRIRHTLVPTLHKIDPRFHTSFAHTLERLQETERFLSHITQSTFNTLAEYNKEKKCYVIDKKEFLACDPVLQYRILVHWLSIEQAHFPVTQAFFDEMLRFIKQPGNKTHTMRNIWHLTKNNHSFYITK